MNCIDSFDEVIVLNRIYPYCNELNNINIFHFVGNL